MARIIVASYVVRIPVGGYQSWMLQWLVGLRRLGHDVWFVEKSGWSRSCLDPATWQHSDDCSSGAAAWCTVLARFGLERRWCYVDAAGEYHGVSRREIEDVFRSADVFIDHMRRCEWRDEAAWTRSRVMIDGEPAYTQFWMANLRANGKPPLMEYDHYFSVGMNIGTPRAQVPTVGKTWRPIVDPVVVDLFRHDAPRADAPFTTIMSWKAQKPIAFDGKSYGAKDVEFPKILHLPARTAAPLELAVSGEIETGPLVAAGWGICESGQATRTYDAWLDYIRRSRGEVSVCKNYFVATSSGAFSDRSAAYLACGRPVVLQDTGFSDHLPCGRGLFAFRTVDEAAAAIETIQADYDRQSKWARELAREYLDAEVVLGRLLGQIGL